MTSRGEVEAGRLRPGDLLLTTSGTGAPLKPLLRTSPAAAPSSIRIRAGALGRLVPLRDLVVLPGQPVTCEGESVTAASLVNGLNVVEEPPAPAVTIELAAPDGIVAEGAPAAARPFIPPLPSPERLAALRATVAQRAAPDPGAAHAALAGELDGLIAGPGSAALRRLGTEAAPAAFAAADLPHD